MRLFFTPNKFLVFSLILISINLILLDTGILPIGNTPKQIETPIVGSSDCPDCKTQITALETKLNDLMSKLNITITPTPTLPFVQQNSQVIQKQTEAKEYYVPFGSGSGDYSDWTDIPGLQAYIDNTAYGKIKQVNFEASVHVPTNNQIVSLRLVNVTENRVIGYSQLDFNGASDSVFKASSPILLDYGQKLYKVQLKTQLKYNTVIDQARVHITSQ